MTPDPTTMLCSYCLKRKAWPDGFPSTFYSVCWDCRWKEHVRDDHRLSLIARRKARRRAIRVATASLLRDEAVERSERLLVPEPTRPDPYIPERGQMQAKNPPPRPEPVTRLPASPPPAAGGVL